MANLATGSALAGAGAAVAGAVSVEPAATGPVRRAAGTAGGGRPPGRDRCHGAGQRPALRGRETLRRAGRAGPLVAVGNAGRRHGIGTGFSTIAGRGIPRFVPLRLCPYPPGRWPPALVRFAGGQWWRPVPTVAGRSDVARPGRDAVVGSRPTDRSSVGSGVGGVGRPGSGPCRFGGRRAGAVGSVWRNGGRGPPDRGSPLAAGGAAGAVGTIAGHRRCGE